MIIIGEYIDLAVDEIVLDPNPKFKAINENFCEFYLVFITCLFRSVCIGNSDAQGVALSSLRSLFQKFEYYCGQDCTMNCLVNNFTSVAGTNLYKVLISSSRLIFKADFVGALKLFTSYGNPESPTVITSLQICKRALEYNIIKSVGEVYTSIPMTELSDKLNQHAESVCNRKCI